MPASTGLLEEVRSSAEAIGGRCFVIDLSGVSDIAGLSHVLGRELRFPYEARGLDVLLDLLSDLEWLGQDVPTVLLFEDLDGLAAANPSAFDSFVQILPNLSDRWQSGRTPFHIVFAVSHEATGEAVERIVYSKIQDSRASPWYRGSHEVRVRRDDIPPALSELAEFLEQRGFARRRQESEYFGDRLDEFTGPVCRVRITRDRGVWSVELAPGARDEWFEADVWRACLDGEDTHIERASLEEQARFVKERWADIEIAIRATPELPECLPRTARARVEKALGLPRGSIP